jgi:hypothetical protein
MKKLFKYPVLVAGVSALGDIVCGAAVLNKQMSIRTCLLVVGVSLILFVVYLVELRRNYAQEMHQD